MRVNLRHYEPVKYLRTFCNLSCNCRRLLYFPASDDHLGGVAFADADKHGSNQDLKVGSTGLEERRCSKVHKRRIDPLTRQKFSHDLRCGVANAAVPYVDHLPVFGFEQVPRGGKSQTIGLDQLRVGASGNDSALNGELASSFKSPAYDRHDPAPHATGFTDFDRIPDVGTNFQRKRESRRLHYTRLYQAR